MTTSAYWNLAKSCGQTYSLLRVLWKDWTCPFCLGVLCQMYLCLTTSALILSLNPRLAYWTPLSLLISSLRASSAEIVKTAFVSDSTAIYAVACVSKTYAIHLLVNVSIMLKQWHQPSMPHQTYVMSVSHNWFGSACLNLSLFPARIMSFLVFLGGGCRLVPLQYFL